MSEKYRVDFEGEVSKKKRDALIDEGWYKAEVKEVILKDSKSSPSKYFEWTLMITPADTNTILNQDKWKGTLLTSRTTTAKGKRWMLKEALYCCGIQKSSDGKYEFNVEDLKKKELFISVKNKKGSFMGNQGSLIETFKSEVSGFSDHAGYLEIE